MGLDIVIPNADFREQGNYQVPVPTGCLGWYFLGGSMAASVRNHAPGGASLTPIGAPVISNAYASLDTQDDYFDTGYADPAAGTFIAVGRSTDTGADPAHNFGYIGKSGVGANGAGLQQGAADQVQFLAYYDDGTGAARTTSLTGAAASSWLCLSADFDNSGQTLRNLTAGISDTDAVATSTRVVGTNNIGLGGGPSSAGFAGGKGDLAFAGIWNRRLSVGEINTVYDALKAYFATFGIEL